MPDNKNHHFVPQSYLKAFGIGRAINIFNHSRGVGFRNAPIKGQCSKDYFYGQDLVLERQLSELEGKFVSALRRIQTDHRLTRSDGSLLLRFWLLQHLRTEAEARRLAFMSHKVVEDKVLDEDFPLSLQEITQMSVGIANAVPTEIDDLKVCILRNNTRIPFVTSDDPAVHTNRLFLTRRDKFPLTPGLRNAGAILIFPLTPDLCFIAYDSDIYSISEKNGFANLNKERDILAINQHQYLNCDANVYFSEWEMLNDIQSEFTKISGNRGARIAINYLKGIDLPDGNRKFVPIDASDIHDGIDLLIHTASFMLMPTMWPSILLNRLRQIAYATGTAAGSIRFAGLLTTQADCKKTVF